MRDVDAAFFSVVTYGRQTDIHTFPTRRSSDLKDEPITIYPSEKGSRFHINTKEAAKQLVDEYGPALIGHLKRFADQVYDRSEEHTSELQSPVQLVCRLRLEKKKVHACDLRLDL